MAILFTVITQLLELHCILSNLPAPALSTSFCEAWLWGGDSGPLWFPEWPPDKSHCFVQPFSLDVRWFTGLPQTLPKCAAKFWQAVKLFFFLKCLCCYAIPESEIAELRAMGHGLQPEASLLAGQRSGIKGGPWRQAGAKETRTRDYLTCWESIGHTQRGLIQVTPG